ncbi:MAG: glycoside hydrolase family 2 [Ruminococcaceae bacterium]|nr:glycoside hydrolase family 2 [Oscillospiraceae bacterium]
MPEQLLTPWGEALPPVPWNIHPRPRLQRDSFLCLNGRWAFGTDPACEETILVPFVPESLLSGIGRPYPRGTRFYYRTVFSLPEGFAGERVLLHFEAVNRDAVVTLNGIRLGEHHGGYAPFTFDVTACLQEQNHLLVEVTNDFDDHILPYGKQRRRRGGMWYTPASGIWQTVWLESVPAVHVEDITVTTDGTTARLTFAGVEEGTLQVETPTGALTVPITGGTATVTPPDPRRWSPEDPYLYRCTVIAGADRVSTYFALRTVEVIPIGDTPRVLLNGEPYFFHGLLDQGYYSDGIFTPGDPDGYTWDIRTAKALGFNMLRKHIKVEPQRFYYECDRLGMVVYQDMVNNGAYSFLRDTALPTVGLKRLPGWLIHRSKAQKAAFRQAMEQTVAQLGSHPSILCWTIFNEGWGQFKGENMHARLRSLDPSRLIDTASGWFKERHNDFDSLHVYFKKVRLRRGDKPVFLSEFGGYSYKPAGHVFNTEKTYGYRLFEEQQPYEDALIALYEQEILPAMAMGLCATVYTQLSDVEDETNGLVSYDRRVVKVDTARMQELAHQLYERFKECV